MKFTMKVITGLLLALVLLAGLATDDALAKKTRLDKVLDRTPQLRDFSVPEVTRAELENGMIIYMVEDHDLPLVNIALTIRGGSYTAPGQATPGVAGLTGSQLRSGGTASMTPASSCPGTWGKVISGSCPIHPCQSLRQSPVAFTRMTTPSPAGLGSGTFWIANGPANSS